MQFLKRSENIVQMKVSIMLTIYQKRVFSVTIVQMTVAVFKVNSSAFIVKKSYS